MFAHVEAPLVIHVTPVVALAVPDARIPHAELSTGEAHLTVSPVLAYGVTHWNAAHSTVVLAEPVAVTVLPPTLLVHFAQALVSSIKLSSWYAAPTRFADVAAVEDALVLTIAKALADEATTTEALALTVSKVLADPAVATDAISILASKGLADVVTAEDVIQVMWAMGQQLDDTVLATDSVQFELVKTLADVVTASDELSMSGSSTTPMGDSASANDQISLSSSKALAESIAAADALAITTNKALSDTATAVDSGLIRMQDYADMTYFAEDYTGTTRTI